MKTTVTTWALLVVAASSASACERQHSGEPIGATQQLLTCAPSSTVRADVSTIGAGANDFSLTADLSADARFVVFSSLGANLVMTDGNGAFDVFRRDRLIADTVRVSVASSGGDANGSSSSPVVSADGQFVAFASDATNLVTGDTNGVTDVFVRDLVSETTTRISVSSGGTQANGPSFAPAMTPDGRFVAFHSNATNLVSGDTNNAADIFLHDRSNHQTTRVSVTDGESQSNGDSWDPALSSDGILVAFASDASNLVASDTNHATDVFVRDRTAGTTTRASVTSSEAQANGRSAAPAISGDGHFVAFESDATNLVSGDTNGATDIFVRDRKTTTTARVSVGTSGGQGNGSSLAPSVSADGQVVAFASDATNLVPGDTNGDRDVFVRQRSTNQTARASVAPDGSQGDDASGSPRLSGDGKAIAFESAAGNFPASGICHTLDIYVRDLASTPAAWAVNVSYTVGVFVTFKGKFYQCLQAHKSQSDWAPDVAHDLWQPATPCGVLPWSPSAHYLVGSIVTFNGMRYRCVQEHTSQPDWSPPRTPALWQVIP